jgi:hypothetical protein
VQPSGGAGDQGRPHGRWLRDRLQPRLPFAGSVVVLKRRAWERASASSLLALAIALSSNLRVTPAETEHMPIYLRTLFRVLSSWVHP